MDFELSTEQKQLQQEIRTYLNSLITPELVEEVKESGGPGGGPIWKAYIQKLAKDGWLGIGWPKEYGGQGRSFLEQYIFTEEVERSGVVIPCLPIQTVGPALMRVGTEEQKLKYLPHILNAELDISIGYTEPNAGTDLAALVTKAVKKEDHWLINGQKVFSTTSHMADYIWLAVRTDPNVPKHKGITIFLVDLKTPGITVDPIWTLDHHRTNVVFLDNVKVPFDSVIGEVNMGWKYITTQLNFERIMLGCYSTMELLLEDTKQWAQETRMDGSLVIEKPWVRDTLADLTANIEVLKLLNYRTAWNMTSGLPANTEASMVKVFGTRLCQRVGDACMQIMGQYGQLKHQSKWALLNGQASSMLLGSPARIFGGGTEEIQLNIIAEFGLGLPRV